MDPEKRLTIQEAVELIARHGASPISESALRARARNRKLGTTKVSGRLYTNALNLVAAGLLPVEVLTETLSTGAAEEIDEQDLYRWLNPDEPDDEPPSPSELQPGLWNDPEAGRPTVDPLPPEDPKPTEEAGPLERLLSGPEQASDASPIDPAPNGQSLQPSHETTEPASHTPGSGALAASSKYPARRLRTLALVAAGVAAVATVALVASAERDGAPVQAQQLRPVSLVAAIETTVPARDIDRAVSRGDYAKALDLAALTGDQASVVKTQRNAADRELKKAERAREDQRLSDARKHLTTIQAALGDPRPAGRRAVAARIAHDQREAQSRARERSREAAAKRAAAKPDSSVPSTVTPTQASAPAVPARTAPAPRSQKASASSEPNQGRDPGLMPAGD